MKKLHVDSVFKTYGTHRVLAGAYLVCKPGEIVGILGRNGSGKSTLLKIIFGSIPSDSSYVSVNGVVYSNRFQRPKKIAYLFQDTFVPNNIKVKTLLKLFRAEELSHHVMVSKILDQTIGELSGGECRYLEVLFILYSKAEYIILDEPFNGLSPILKEEIKIEIRKSPKGIIITDHDYRNVLDLTTKNLLLTNGSIQEIRDIEELRTKGYLPSV